MGLGLADSDVIRLNERTEGWAVGVLLVALSLRHQTDAVGFVEHFAGDDRHVADYLRDEVLAHLPDRVRGFLLDTAILDRLTAPLCAAMSGVVSGVGEAQALLDELERLNLFVVPLDHRRGWYRYHHLFSEWLRLQGGADLEARHRRAAEWLDEHELPGEAVRHFVAAGEPDRAADVIDREHWILVGQGREETLREWTRLLPDEVLRRRPRLTFAAAWVAHHAGRWDEVGALVELLRATTALAEEPDRDLLHAEIELLDAGRLVALGDVADAARCAERGLGLVARDEPRARTGLLLVLGRCRLAAGDLDGAQQAFCDAEELAAPYGVTIVLLIGRAHRAEIDRRAGRSAEAEVACRETIAFAEASGLGDHPESTVAHLTLGNLLLDSGRVDEAEAAIRRGTELAARVPYVAREAEAAAANRRLAGVGSGSPATGLEQLTGREQSVLRLLPTSLTPREIAAELYLSLNTIKTHTRSLYRKLGVQTRHEAIEQARQRDLL
jgi:LuxR family maltose regulon positive regulatory protein